MQTGRKRSSNKLDHFARDYGKRGSRKTQMPSKGKVVRTVSTLELIDSDVPAWLGLKAGALAWPEGALASKFIRPSRKPKLGQSRGLALARVGLAADKT
jgi:hypothetical protein